MSSDSYFLLMDSLFFFFIKRQMSVKAGRSVPASVARVRFHTGPCFDHFTDPHSHNGTQPRPHFLERVFSSRKIELRKKAWKIVTLIYFSYLNENNKVLIIQRTTYLFINITFYVENNAVLYIRKLLNVKTGRNN